MKNETIQKKYWRRAKLAAYILQLTPFIRMIGLNGSLARGEGSDRSDIDFLIITKPGRIWTCRAFSIFLMMICGLKRYQDKIAGRVCLNLYQTEDHLKLSYLDHRESPEWLAKDYAHMVPLWQKGRVFEGFVVSNSWVKKYGENFHYQDYEPNLIDQTISIICGLIRNLTEIIFDLFSNEWMEQILKKYQVKRIKNNPVTINSKHGEIFISDDELRFHPDKTI